VTRNAHDAGRKAPELIALLVALIAAGCYLALPSSRHNPDGLRVFPGLRRVTVDTVGAVSFVPDGWSAGYQAPRYERANTQKHFLFPLYGFVGYRIARGFGYRGNGLKPLQVANAISAALAAGLFALLVGLLVGSPWTVLAAGFGLAFSAAFSSMATSIAEVVPALPWLMLALILLATDENLRPGRTACAGFLLGTSAAFYFVSAAVGAAFALYLALRRTPRRALLLAGAMLSTTAAIYVLVLLLAGYHTLPRLGHALFFMPEQGTYGGFKLSNLVSVGLGFAGSLFPVLPDNFGGLRSLLGQASTGRGLLLAVVTPLVILLAGALFVALFRTRRQLAVNARRIVGLGLVLFAGALVVSLVWDPYHLKLWTYSNIGLWLMIAGYLAHESRTRQTSPTGLTFWRPTFIALVLLCVVPTNLAHRKADAGGNPKWQAAQAVAAIVNAQPGSIVLGGWEDEFDYLALLVPESNQVSLPDVIMELDRDSTRFAGFATRTLSSARDRGGSVFFLNLFNRGPVELEAFYVRRLRFPEFITWLESLRPQAQETWSDPETGVHLYRLAAGR